MGTAVGLLDVLAADISFASSAPPQAANTARLEANARQRTERSIRRGCRERLQNEFFFATFVISSGLPCGDYAK
jgi:hypothetical protein